MLMIMIMMMMMMMMTMIMLMVRNYQFRSPERLMRRPCWIWSVDDGIRPKIHHLVWPLTCCLVVCAGAASSSVG
jgi:hypothetical protein